MTAVQLNAEIYRAMGVIAEDEQLLARAAKYLKKLASTKQADSTVMTKEEFLAKLEQGEEDYRQGRTYAMLPGESFSDFRKRIGR